MDPRIVIYTGTEDEAAQLADELGYKLIPADAYRNEHEWHALVLFHAAPAVICDPANYAARHSNRPDVAILHELPQPPLGGGDEEE